jgi:hypothetical protein
MLTRDPHLYSCYLLFRRNLYGFELITDRARGDARGGYSHELFRRDRPEMCRKMRRVNIHHTNRKAAEKEEKDTSEKTEEEPKE